MRTSLVIILTFILLLSLVLSSTAPGDLSKPYLAMCVFLSILIFVFQCLLKLTDPKPRNWLTIDILALFTFWLVHFLFPAYWVMGKHLVTADSLSVWVNEAVVCRATMMSISAMAAFAIGFNIIKNRYLNVIWELPYDYAGLIRWKWAANILFVMSGIFIALLILVVGATLFSGQYSGALESYSGKIIIIILSLTLEMSLSLMTFVAASMTGKWKIGITAKLFFIFIITYILILGDRGMAARIALVAAFGYSETVKGVSFKKLAIVIIAGTFLMAVVQIARTSPERTLPSFVKTALEFKDEINVEAGFLNLGSSARTLYAAVDAVPSGYNYFYGKLKMGEIIAFVPFGNKLLGIVTSQYINSQYFLTWIMFGNFYSGAGSTVVADIYLDFGYPGVVIVMFLLGFFCKWLQQRFRSTGSFVAGVGYCTLAVTVMKMSRSGVCDVIRGAFWPMLLVCFIAWMFQIKKCEPDQVYLDKYE